VKATQKELAELSRYSWALEAACENPSFGQYMMTGESLALALAEARRDGAVDALRTVIGRLEDDDSLDAIDEMDAEATRRQSREQI
jgi:hypothetical protein